MGSVDTQPMNPPELVTLPSMAKKRSGVAAKRSAESPFDRVFDSPYPDVHTTVQSVIESLGMRGWLSSAGEVNFSLFAWPPDAFAVAATVLRDSGAYLQAVKPHRYAGVMPPYELSQWLDHVRTVATDWRSINVLDSAAEPPQAVQSLLRQIGALCSGKKGAAGRAPLTMRDLAVENERNLSWLPFLQLMCIADETCRGVGVIFPVAKGDHRASPHDGFPGDSIVASWAMIRILAQQLARDQGEKGFRPVTLCTRIDPCRAIVAPKMRTSQRGVTIRSFSHHLALLEGADVEPVWSPAVNSDDPAKLSPQSRGDRQGSGGPYNFIILPWPLEIRPAQFQPLEPHLTCLGGRPPKNHQFFKFIHDEGDPAHDRAKIQRLIHEAQKRVGDVHGVILPEMAMTRRHFDAVFPSVPEGVQVIACGVYEPPFNRRRLGRNYAVVRRRVVGGRFQEQVEQDKHHRWALDPGQLSTYSLGSSLSPGTTWWEGINLPNRRVHFFGLDDVSAFTVLICEDLARPDPVADAVRAVGPNLVICLLLDGPQLSTRWSARYATVLADDPGSSVLTVSSLGMVQLSRLRDRLHEQSRVVALWRETSGTPTELTLPPGHDAMVISLSLEIGTERSLDGRDDHDMAAVVRLAGVHHIKDKQKSTRGSRRRGGATLR
jgi:hypothetical protein